MNYKETKMKSIGDTGRIDWIDLARGLLIISVVMGHSMGGSNLELAINKFICSFHMVAFFFLSGLTISEKSLSKPFKDFILNKAFRLLVPFLFFIVIGAPFNLMERYLKYGTIGTFVNYIIPKGGWFLLVLFYCEMLTFVILKAFKDKRRLGGGIIIALSVVYVVSTVVLHFNGYTMFTLNNFPIFLYLDLILVCYPFMTIGFFLKSIAGKSLALRYRILCLALGFLCLGALVYTSQNNEQVIVASFSLGHSIMFFYLNSILGILSLSLFCIAVKNALPINYVGKNSMGIFLVHFYILTIVNYLFNIIFGEENNIILNLCAWAIVLVASTIFSVFVKKYIPIIIGEHKINKL